MIKLIHKACPGRILFAVLRNIIEKIFYAFFFVYLIKYIITYIENDIPFSQIITFLTIAVIGQAIVYTITAIYDYYLMQSNIVLYQYIYKGIIEKSLQLPIYFFESPDYYDNFYRALDNTKENAEKIVYYLAESFGQISRIITIIVMVIKIDPIMLLFPIIPLLNSLLTGILSVRILFHRKNDITKDQRMAEYIRRIFYEKKYSEEVRLFNLKTFLFKMHQDSYKRMLITIRKYNKKIIYVEIWNKIVLRIFLIVLSTFYVTYQIVIKGKLSIGIYASLMAAITNISWAVEFLFVNLTEFFNQVKQSKNLKLFMEINENKNHVLSKYQEIPNNFNNLELKNVYFNYPGSDKLILKNINLKINKGEKIAIVGNNGAGKSTLIKLILGLYRSDIGEVTFNSINIEKFDTKNYRKKFITVFQDFHIYALPICNNILMKKELSNEDINRTVDALDKVGLKEKVFEYKEGIKHQLTHEFNNEGKLLSVGESQKLAIARIFANIEADIVILDEPSSALDPIAEYEIFKSITEAVEGRTLIFITHRLSSARIADRIYMINEGSIIEEGAHDELMKNNQQYANMYQMQAKKYKINHEI